MKLKEIREAYEALSGTFSKTSRTLALTGIAIVWLFMPYFNELRLLFIVNLIAACAFVLMIFADLLQNYILSKMWYHYYKRMKETFKKNEDDDLKEDENKNKIGWILYDLKFCLLIIGYVALFICFVRLFPIFCMRLNTIE